MPRLSLDDWSTRWQPLARAAGIHPEEKLLLALSGGADSVLLLHWLAAAVPAAPLRAVHVDHGLRAEESAADARFCVNLCRALGVPCQVLRADLDPAGPGLEERARVERYRLLAEEARQSGHRTVLTGHHSDDALETVLQRWVRGTDLSGLRGARAELVLGGRGEALDGEPAVRVVRPLLLLRREEVRALLSARGLRWREDSSNADPRFARSRVRHGLLPLLEHKSPGWVDDLRAFGRAIEELEDGFAEATAHLRWRPGPYASALRGPAEQSLGGVLERGPLMALPRTLARRTLWRLLTEGTGRAPRRAALEAILFDLAQGRATRHSLSGGWTLLLRSRELALLPPSSAPARRLAPAPRQLHLSFLRAGGEPLARSFHELTVPGIVTLADGRRISAEVRPVPRGAPITRRGLEVELDARDLPAELAVRWPEPGDRFHALGAPGSKPLTRFLADRGIPREERSRVPLVLARARILWAAGIAPAEEHRVHAGTERRLWLALH